jgi:hypothetical protein
LAKAKRERRSSIRNMSAGDDALEALERLERLERQEREADRPRGEDEPAASPEGDGAER